MLRRNDRKSGLVPINFELGVDRYVYERAISLNLHPNTTDAYTAVGFVSISGSQFELPQRKRLDVRRKPFRIYVQPEIAQNVHSALVQIIGGIGTKKVDCYAFAAAYAGIEVIEEDFRKQWRITAEKSYPSSVAGKVMCVTVDDVTEAEAVADGSETEHWFVPLDEQGQSVINIGWSAGPLMLCCRSTIQSMYPHAGYAYVAEPV